MTGKTFDSCAASPRSTHRVLHWLDGYTAALFAGSPWTFAAFGVVIAVWALELVMNTRNGHGWVSMVHFLVVGPLWLAFTGITLYAFARQVLGWGGTRAK